MLWLFAGLAGILGVAVLIARVSQPDTDMPTTMDTPDEQFTKMVLKGSKDVRRTYSRDEGGRMVVKTVLTDPRTGVTLMRTKRYGGRD